MVFAKLYRISFYLMLFLATLILNIESSDNILARLGPPAVAITCAAAYFTVDRNPRYGLSLGTAVLLAWMAIILSWVEYTQARDSTLLSIAHLLTYLQMIEIMRVKTNKNEWILFLVSLMQVIVGSVLSVGGDQIGGLILLWAVWSLWTLALFYLYRMALRSEAGVATQRAAQLRFTSNANANSNTNTNAETTGIAKGARIPGAARERDREMYPGLIDQGFLMETFGVTMLTLVLGGIIFLLMPRLGTGQSMRNSGGSGAKQTGFQENNVKIGKMGQLLETDSLVMTVNFTDAAEKPFAPDPEKLYWRGTTMGYYVRGEWKALSPKKEHMLTYILSPPDSSLPKKQIRQDINLENPNLNTRFALRPIFKIPGTSNNGAISLNTLDGTLVTNDRNATKQYQVWSDADGNTPQPGELPPDQPTLDINPALKAELRAIAKTALQNDNLLANANLSDALAKNMGKARALEAHLRDSGLFAYSLKLDRADPNIDPVLDFLINVRSGHCEYYASALTLLLRSIDIPARLVNGFKGGDWNSLSQALMVRQKHAHAWVEAYVPNADGIPVWITLDPTPSGERALSIAKVGGFSANFRQITDAINYIWTFYIQGYNAERQNRMIYQPLRRLIFQSLRGFGMMRDALVQLYSFPDLKSFFNIQGFFATFLPLTVLLLVYRLLRRVGRFCSRFLRKRRHRLRADDSDIVFYGRLLRLLRNVGLDRPDAETPKEFAQRVQSILTKRHELPQNIAAVPLTVVDAFYRIRFGGAFLDDDDLAALDLQLNGLEHNLADHAAASAAA